MISIQNLSKTYDDYNALKGIFLEIGKGEVYGLLGTNGAGKTTTIKILATLLKPTDGTALMNGVSILEDPIKVRENLGYLPEMPALYEYLTGREFLEFIGGLKGWPKKDAACRGEELRDIFSLQDHYEKLIGTYSKGLKQRLAFAQAIFHEPDILLLDEPVLGLDPVHSNLVKNILDDYKKSGKTVLVSTHLAPFAEEVCTKVGIIHQGSFLASGTMDELIEESSAATLEEAFITYIRGSSGEGVGDLL